MFSGLHVQPLYTPWTVFGTTRVSHYQKSKTNLDLLEQEIESGSGISWAICKFASQLRQITIPAFHHSVFTGWMPFLPPNQQIKTKITKSVKSKMKLIVQSTRNEVKVAILKTILNYKPLTLVIYLHEHNPMQSELI